MTVDIDATLDAVMRSIAGSGVSRAEAERLVREAAPALVGDVVAVDAIVSTDPTTGLPHLALVPVARRKLPSFLGGHLEFTPGVVGPGKELVASSPARP